MEETTWNLLRRHQVSIDAIATRNPFVTQLQSTSTRPISSSYPCNTFSHPAIDCQIPSSYLVHHQCLQK